jgi:hypothetical protein
MSNTVSRMWLLGGWLATVAVIVAWSIAAGASLSTSALVLVICVAPVVVMAVVGSGGSPSPTVAEVLHAVNAEEDRG